MSCFNELLQRYKDKLPEDRLQKIYDKVSEYKDDGNGLGADAKGLRDRLMYEFKREVHTKVMQEISSRRVKSFANSESFKKTRQEFIEKVMPDLDSPDPKVREAAIKKMKKMNLRAPIEARAAGLETFAEGGNRHYRLLQQQKEAEFLNAFEAYLGRDLSKLMAKGEFDLDVAKAVHDLGSKKPITSYHPDIQKMAHAVHRLNKAVVDDLSEAGVWIPERQNYIMRQTHNPDKIQDIGKTAWVDKMMEPGVLDRQLVFGGEISAKKQKEILADIYDDIMDGSYGQSSVGAFTGARGIHFASPEAFINYNKEFGKGNMFKTMVDTSRSASKNYARTELFGINPKLGVKMMDEEITKGFSPTAKRLYEDKTLFSKNRNIDNQLNEIMGDMEYPVSKNNIVNALRTGRTLISAAKLKFSVFSTFTDLSFGRLISSSGIHVDRMNSIGEFAKKITNSKDRALWERRLDMNFGLMAKDADKYGSFSGQSGGAVDRFYRRYVMPMNAMGLQNAAAKLTWGAEISMALGNKYANRTFGELDARLQNTLKRYEISEADWEKIRNSKEEIEDGSFYIGPDSVRNAGGDKALASKVSVMINDLARGVGSPEAGVKEISLITQGSSHGSLEREFLLSLGQFKSFALTIPKVMKRAANNNPEFSSNQMMDVLMNLGEMKQLGMFMAEMTMISGAALVARSVITKGEMPDTTSKEFWMEAAQRGAMPMFASSLLDIAKGEYAQFGRSMFKDLAGPTVSEVDKMVKFLSGAAETGGGNWEEGAQLILEYLPGQQLTHIAPLGLHSFAEQLKEMERPGYLERLEMRKQEKGTINLFR